jgi:putative lipoprotein
VNHPSNSAARQVTGEVVLPADTDASATADLVVQVEDVSRADAPSTVIAEHRTRGVSLQSGASIPFSLEVSTERVSEGNRYSVRVHIDVSGSGEVEV